MSHKDEKKNEEYYDMEDKYENMIPLNPMMQQEYMMPNKMNTIMQEEYMAPMYPMCPMYPVYPMESMMYDNYKMYKNNEYSLETEDSNVRKYDYDEVSEIVRRIERFNPGIYRRLNYFGVPYAASRRIVRRIVTLTLEYK